MTYTQPRWLAQLDEENPERSNPHLAMTYMQLRWPAELEEKPAHNKPVLTGQKNKAS
jgi:hypothetical protein